MMDAVGFEPTNPEDLSLSQTRLTTSLSIRTYYTVVIGSIRINF